MLAACLVLSAAGCSRQPAPASAPAPTPAAVASSAATGQAAASAFDPTGTYELAMESIKGRFTVTANIRVRSDGTLAGLMASSTTPMLTIRTGTVRGNTLTMRVAADDASEARVELTVTGEHVTGRWVRDGGDVLRVIGRRVR